MSHLGVGPGGAFYPEKCTRIMHSPTKFRFSKLFLYLSTFHYRIIYQTFYGMRDVIGPLRRTRGTAVLPFQYRKLRTAKRVLVESCPSSSLKRLGLPHQNYKQ